MAKEAKTEKVTDKQRETCGIVMPISSIDGLSESHWSEMLATIKALLFPTLKSKELTRSSYISSGANRLGLKAYLRV